MSPSVGCDWLSTFERPTSLNSIASSADASTGEFLPWRRNPYWPNSSIVLSLARCTPISVFGMIP